MITKDELRTGLSDITIFSSEVSRVKLRAYQRRVACAIANSVYQHLGLTFVVIFPRQSGKNELQAQLETYFLTMANQGNAEIVKVSPTWKPQALNAMRRLERILKRNWITAPRWKKEQGYIYNVGGARIYFLSGSPTSNIVGHTASMLLECDEAQDVLISKWDKDIAPMAASTNATRVFWGTAWTSQTLLAREKSAALELQKQDGIQRVFEIDADLVRKEVAAYGKFVDGEVARHGRNHPFIKTQYYSEEIDETGGMFPPERIALLHGAHPYQLEPLPGRLYAFLLDIAGSDENSNVGQAFSLSGDPSRPPSDVGQAFSLSAVSLSAVSPSGDSSRPTERRDHTALTIIEIILPKPGGILPGDQMPTFNIVHRRSWSGASQVTLFRQIYSLADLWRPHRLVVDATGVGEGLSSFLSKTYPSQVIPFKFSQASKSDLGWKLLSAIETGRLKDFALVDGIDPGAVGCGLKAVGSDLPTTDQRYLQAHFYRQLRACTLELVPGPGKIIRWSVPESMRDPETGELIHDDFLLSMALCAALFDEKGLGPAKSAVIKAYDPLQEMSY